MCATTIAPVPAAAAALAAVGNRQREDQQHGDQEADEDRRKL